MSIDKEFNQFLHSNQESIFSDTLESYGFNTFFKTQWEDLHKKNKSKTSQWQIGRIIHEERNFYGIQSEDKKLLADLAGKFFFNLENNLDLPKVGDWVAFTPMAGTDRGLIQHVFERQSILSRKDHGEALAEQVLACNVDLVFLTTSLNSDLNFNRLDRYLVLCRASSVEPIIVLTKSDLISNDQLQLIIEKIRNQYPNIKCVAVSATNQQELIEFRSMIKRGKTAVFLGSSGVGKSTLCNYLLGTNDIEVQAIRESDHKGRHTTTRRQMFVCPQGGVIIDTPGMRSVALGNHNEGFTSEFSDIETIATKCKFTNCSHSIEPQCEIQGQSRTM